MSKQPNPRLKPATENWLRDFSAAACAEGWDVFDSDGELQIQRIDDPEGVAEDLEISVPELSGDEDAWGIVADGVRRGSPLHLRAWKEISEAERKRIIEKCGPVE